MIDFQKELNESQLQAVQYCEGPSLVIAGAGSGKTRVLTYKIAWLLEQGLAPWNILALTFTNKAAREMRDRIARLVGDDRARPLWMGTFHSIFSRILRAEADLIGYDHNFTIYDAHDSQSLIKTILKEQQLGDKQYKPSTVAARISEAKNNLMLPSRYANDIQARQRDNAQKMGALYMIYEIYAQRLRQSNAMDFDDLLLHTFYLFQEHEDVRQRYAERFQYILVDEYQDTNFAQDQIVWLLAKDSQRLCVVGDDAQSIYSFRGARIDNILDYQKRYTGVQLFKLERNYRSTQNIVNAAGKLIANNRRQIEKHVYSEKPQGESITVLEAYSDKEEAGMVARKISDLRLAKGYEWDEIAILYRTNSQSRAFEDEFRRQGFPYRIYGGLSFYQRKEIKDTLAYFRLAVNPHDEESLRRVINYPARGIGNTTIEKIFACADEHRVAPWEVVAQPEAYQLDVNKGTMGRLTAFAAMIQQFQAEAVTTDAYQLALRIVDVSGVKQDIFSGKDPEDISRQENLQELVDSMNGFVTDAQEEGRDALLANYLQEVSLVSDLDQEQREQQATGQPVEDRRITLMTVHSAKGLEFRAVFVVGLEENLFPSQMSLDSPRELEEERRLMYVAMTRAEEKLFLTWSHSRMRFGKFENNQKSRFLREIGVGESPASRAAVPFPEPRAAAPRTVWPRPSESVSPYSRPSAPASSYRRIPSASPSASPSPSSADWRAGTRVRHDRFGTGTVQHLEGSGMDARVTVLFDNCGTKVLLLRFAKLAKI